MNDLELLEMRIKERLEFVKNPVSSYVEGLIDAYNRVLREIDRINADNLSGGSNVES